MMTLPPQSFFIAIVTLCVLVLFIAVSAAYYGGLKACPLCLYQRYCFMAIAGFAVLGLGLKKVPSWFFIAVIGMVFLLNMAIAGYQVLIEHQIIEPPQVCKIPVVKAQTIDELRASLRGVKHIPCDQVSWSFLNISMAGYNALLCFIMTFISGIIFKRTFSKETVFIKRD